MVYFYDYCVILFHNFYRYRAAHDTAQLYAGGIFITDRHLVIVGLSLNCTLINVVGFGCGAKFLITAVFLRTAVDGVFFHTLHSAPGDLGRILSGINRLQVLCGGKSNKFGGIIRMCERVAASGGTLTPYSA